MATSPMVSQKVKSLVDSRNNFGYRSITKFVPEAVRRQTEEIAKTRNQVTHLS